MHVPSPDSSFDSSLALPLTEAAEAAGSPKPSLLEEEIVSLFDQMQDRLLRYLLSLGLTAPDGEEVVQEVFLALFQHLRRGKPRHNLRAWLFQVAHNLALKQRNAVRRIQLKVAELDEATAENFFVDLSPNPEDQVVSHQRQGRLLGVLRALPEQDRRCLALRAEGLNYREIAQVLGISLGSVSLSLGRSLARFTRADER
jgi:RNA polymerase sigma-70 factor (ECF subfamily)